MKLSVNGPNLPKKSVINMTQTKTVDKNSLKKKIGILSRDRMAEVYEGMKLVMDIP